MLKIITANLNGIRSAANKGFLNWMGAQQQDLVCVQELKAQAGDLGADITSPEGYYGYFHYAEKKGYSGVGIYSRYRADSVIMGVGDAEFDGLVVAGFEVQAVVIFQRAPGASVEGVIVKEIEGAGDGLLVFVQRDDEQDVFRHGFADAQKKIKIQNQIQNQIYSLGAPLSGRTQLKNLSQ